MVDQANIFNEDGTSVTAGDSTQAFQIPETASTFIGEGKKYSDVSKALESIPHAQSHIQTLEAELESLKTKFEARSSVEETLQNFIKDQKNQVTDPPTRQPEIDLNTVADLVNQQLQASKDNDVKQGNISEVVKTLTEKFGDRSKAHEAFQRKAQDLGVDIGYLNELASTSPKAVYALFGESKPVANSPSFGKTSVNTEALNTTPTSQPKPVQSVMSGSSTSEVLAAWRDVTSNIGA
jgi:hypothetical protein